MKNLVLKLMVVLFILGSTSLAFSQTIEGLKEIVIYERVVPDEFVEVAAAFIALVVKNANPMSDEEPEDNIREARKTAIELYGKPILGLMIYTSDGSYHEFVSYDELTDTQKAVCDKFKSTKRK